MIPDVVTVGEEQPELVIGEGTVQEIPVGGVSDEIPQEDSSTENTATSGDGQQSIDGESQDSPANPDADSEPVEGQTPDETVSLETVQTTLDSILAELQEGSTEPVETVTYTKELKAIKKSMDAQYDLGIIILVGIGLVFGLKLASVFWKRFS